MMVLMKSDPTSLSNTEDYGIAVVNLLKLETAADQRGLVGVVSVINHTGNFLICISWLNLIHVYRRM